MPRNPNKTPCSVPGCRAWAIRGSDPPRCSPHSHQACPEPGPGQACPESIRGACPESIRGACPESVRGVGAPLGNQNHLVHGFYRTVLDPQEIADLGAYAADVSLDAEIAITRVALRRILGMLLTGVTPGPHPRPLHALDYARFAGLAFQGAGTVARLLRARHALPGAEVEPLVTFLDQVLDQLGTEWGIQL